MSTLPRAKWTRAKLPEPLKKHQVRQSYKTFINEVPILNRDRVRLLEQQQDLEQQEPSFIGRAHCDDEEDDGDVYNADAVEEVTGSLEMGKEGSMQTFNNNHGANQDDLFSRSSLRTPPEVRRSILSTMSMTSAEEQYQLEVALGGITQHGSLVGSTIAGDGASMSIASASVTVGGVSGGNGNRQGSSSLYGSSLLRDRKKEEEGLNSHKKASVRGFLAPEDLDKVDNIAARLEERKTLIAQARANAKLRQDAPKWRTKLLQDGMADSQDEFKMALSQQKAIREQMEQAEKTGQALDSSLSRRSAFMGPGLEPTRSSSGGGKPIDPMEVIKALSRSSTPEGLLMKGRRGGSRGGSGAGSRVSSRGAPHASLSGVSAPPSQGATRPGSRDGRGRGSPVPPQGGGSAEEAARAASSMPPTTKEEEEKRARQLENDQKIAEERSKYFGSSSRKEFIARFRSAARDLRVMPKDEHIPEEVNTPRHMYLREVTKQKLLPLPTILRKETHPKGIFLAHKGLGDVRMLPVVEVLHRLPSIETVDLCDNRLTDTSLMPMMSKLVHMPSLTYLDLSFNDMDDSSVSIQEFIRAPSCFLETLLINGSDVDDYECCNLCEAMIENKSIKVLGLANNLIGNEEYKKVTKPNLFLGGNGIAKMLEHNETLESLDLTYNQIRAASAVAIGKSIRLNKKLKRLKLAYNSFGDLGTQWLGHSLKYNTTLEDLDLTSNVLEPKCVCVLTNSLAFNSTLHNLVLDDNILGLIGSQSVAAAIQRSSHSERDTKLNLSFKSCDCFKQDKTVFNPSKPGGKWNVKMNEPYGQMIAEECMYLANHRAGCNINKLTIDKKEVPLERAQIKQRQFNINNFHKQSKNAAKATIACNFREAAKALIAVLKEFRFIMPEPRAVEVVTAVQASWDKKHTADRTEDLHEVFLVEVFSALFIINDEDRSGSMDEDEFLTTLASLGYHNFDRHRLLTFMAEYDRDNSGTIDGGEFAMIMVKEFCRTDVPRGVMVDSSTKKPWKCPDEGAVMIEVVFEIDAPSSHDVGNDDGIRTLINGIVNAQTGEQKDVLFQQACQSPYFFFTAEQAQMLFDDSISAGLSKLPLDMIIAIMPQIVNEEQVNRFLDQNLNDQGRLALRVRMGPLYNAFVGLGTGHYFIDFSTTLHTMGAKRLAALSVNESKATRAIGANTSQKGNGSNFRNEMLGPVNKQVPITVDGQWFADPPDHGELRFDYVSTKRPLIGTLPFSAVRLSRLVRKMDLNTILSIDKRLVEIKALRKEHGFASSRKLGRQSSALFNVGGSVVSLTGSFDESDLASASIASVGSESVDGVSLDSPSGSVVSPSQLLGVQSSPSSGSRKSKLEMEVAGSPDGKKKLTKEQLEQLEMELLDEEEHLLDFIKPQQPVTMVSCKEQYYEYIHSCHHHTTIYPDEVMRDVSRMNYNPDPDFRPPTPDVLATGEAPHRRKMPKIYPYAMRKLLELQVMMPTIFITIEQLAELMAYFPSEGYLRVQLILSVFSHIIDIENFGTIYDHLLSDDEKAEVLHRLGCLNVFDPMDPDREYKLDLRRWDHREMCKILVLLGAHEPGDNWVDGGEYRWSKYDDPVPGWVLPAKWAAKDEMEGGSRDNGPRREGWSRLTYTSTGVGCAPDMMARRHLRRKTLSGLKQLL